MRLLVTGRNGQLARSLAERSRDHADLELAQAARPEIDLSVPGSLADAIMRHRPDVIVNAAGYTAVDLAESAEDNALRVNAAAACEGGRAAAGIGARFIQLSTDYVFDGQSQRPWREDDSVRPINIYGHTKAEGERAVIAASPAHIVVRTSWLVSPFGHNFVRTMLRLASERDEVTVVADQRGSPTSALDLADSLIALARKANSGEARGIYHLAGSGEASWAELAQFILEVSDELGGPFATVRPIATSDYSTPALRPTNSVLDCTKARDQLSIVLPDWHGSVRVIVQRLLTS